MSKIEKWLALVIVVAVVLSVFAVFGGVGGEVFQGKLALKNQKNIQSTLNECLTDEGEFVYDSRTDSFQNFHSKVKNKELQCLYAVSFFESEDQDFNDYELYESIVVDGERFYASSGDTSYTVGLTLSKSGEVFYVIMHPNGATFSHVLHYQDETNRIHKKWAYFTLSRYNP